MRRPDYRKLRGRFVLERAIGSGGMATVYLGRDEVLERRVAVKLLRRSLALAGKVDHDTASRFRREGRTAARLSHANIVPVYDAGEDLFIRQESGSDEPEEVSYIVMEYVSGGDLGDRIEAGGRLSRDEVCRLGAGAADGLEHAHGRGVVHRDVKPKNILIDAGGRPKLTDFGIARALESATRATLTGHFLGTALYSAPEQLRGEKVGGATDVYALGATLYHAATGEPPFAGTVMEVAGMHLDEAPVPPHRRVSAVDPRLSETIMLCLSKDPRSRPTATEVSERLLAIAGAERAGNLGARHNRSPRNHPAPPVVSTPTTRAPEARNVEADNAPGATSIPPKAEGERLESSGGLRFGLRRGGRRGVLVGVAVVAVSAVVVLALVSTGGNLVPGGGAPERAAEAPSGASENGGSGVSGGGRDQAAGGGSEETTGVAESGSEGDAVESVRQMYARAVAGDYAASYARLTQEMRQTVAPTEDQWSGQFSTLESLEFVGEPEVEVSGGIATVSGVTRAQHTDRTELNTAVWTLIREDGEWKVDNQSILSQEIV